MGVSGHQQIPIQALGRIRDSVNDLLALHRIGLVGVSSLAAGADQLFASSVLEHSGELHAIIPCRSYETTFTNPSDLQNYRALLESASRVDVLTYELPSQQAFLDAGRSVVDSSDILIAIWDGEPARGLGGTGDTVAYARERGVTVEIIWPNNIVR